MSTSFITVVNTRKHLQSGRKESKNLVIGKKTPNVNSDFQAEKKN